MNTIKKDDTSNFKRFFESRKSETDIQLKMLVQFGLAKTVDDAWAFVLQSYKKLLVDKPAKRGMPEFEGMEQATIALQSLVLPSTTIRFVFTKNPDEKWYLTNEQSDATSLAELLKEIKKNLPGSKTSPKDQHLFRVAALQLHRRTQDLRGLRYHSPSSYNQPPLSYSWMTELLPYLGQKKLYDKFDFKKSWGDRKNRKLAQTIIPQFLNPGDPRKKIQEFSREMGLAVTHFVGMSGIEDRRNVVAAQLPRSDPRAGVFGYDRVVRPKEITDGTSQTIMVIGVEMARPWIQGGGSTIRGARKPYFKGPTGSRFGSRGQAGAMVLMADGSARLIPPNIDPSVFRAMCTIHGADSVDLSPYPKKPKFFMNLPPPPKVQKKRPTKKPKTLGVPDPNPAGVPDPNPAGEPNPNE